MRKFLILIILTLALAGNPAAAFESNAIVKFDVPYSTFYSGTFDNLVLEFSLITVRPDVLKVVSLRNIDEASPYKHVSKMSLWADAGPSGFQGSWVDREVGLFAYSESSRSWYAENINEPITDNQKFFVSVEAYSFIDKNGVMQMEIPKLVDNNLNGSFDVGDLGIFMDSGNNGPTNAAVKNSNKQVFSYATIDVKGPKIVVANLTDGLVFSNDHFVIQGFARDQGNHGVKSLAVKINDQLFTIDNYDPASYAWTQELSGLADGLYNISIQAYDDWGNIGKTVAMNIEVKKQFLSAAFSAIKLDNDTILNDGLDAIKGKTIVRDINDQPVANRQIVLTVPEDVRVTYFNNFTDSNGEVAFEIRSTRLGIIHFGVQADGEDLTSSSFVAVEESLLDQNLHYGDLIQAGNKAVYYYGADGKRYVFPTEAVYFSWYGSFANIKKISDAQLALIPIGGNVTFKPGASMVKISTDPRVYAVDFGGVLRWVPTEEIASQLYGGKWTQNVRDVADSFFTNYQVGAPIVQAADYNIKILTESVSSINIDKNLL